MPQLLCSLEAEEGDLETLVAAARAEAAGGASPESLDWGTVAVYTCSASCEPAPGAACVYSDEFVWHQPVSWTGAIDIERRGARPRVSYRT